MTPIEQVREALEAAKHAMTNQRYLLPRLGTEDAHAKVTSAIAILKDMDGQEPVADEEQELADHYLYMGWLGARPDRPWTDEDAREAFLHALEYARAHPSPSAPVDIAEIIAAGDRAIQTWDEGAIEAWTEATAKHRTA